MSYTSKTRIPPDHPAADATPELLALNKKVQLPTAIFFIKDNVVYPVLKVPACDCPVHLLEMIELLFAAVKAMKEQAKIELLLALVNVPETEREACEKEPSVTHPTPERKQ